MAKTLSLRLPRSPIRQPRRRIENYSPSSSAAPSVKRWRWAQDLKVKPCLERHPLYQTPPPQRQQHRSGLSMLALRTPKTILASSRRIDDGRFEAFDTDKVLLGLFETFPSACDAI